MTMKHQTFPPLLLLSQLIWALLIVTTTIASNSKGVEAFQSSNNNKGYGNVKKKVTMGFEAIYQFGDSLSDTGNLIREGPGGPNAAYAKLPYGQTYFHRPTGRCSDGLLMVDYIAMYFHLPLLNPYLAKGNDFSHGANFAVAGASALDAASLASWNVSASVTNSCLATQLSWFKTHLSSLCSSFAACRERLQKSLVLMGEIGGNDFNFAFFQGKTIEEAYPMVPVVVQTIKNAVQEVVDLGAMNVVVPGNFPIGCVPLYLVGFKSNDPSMYDELGCLKRFNNFAQVYNSRLQQAIKELQQENPEVTIVYGDYYSALRWINRRASSLGFEKGGQQRTCCATANNPYNFDLGRRCGSPGVPVCPDPSKRVSWDGIHMTQQGNKFVARFLLRQFVPRLQLPILS